MTTDLPIQAMKRLVELLEKQESICKACVDEKRRDRNFVLHVTPTSMQGSPGRRLRSLVQVYLPAGAQIRQVTTPKRRYRVAYAGGPRKAVGYNRAHWTFDIEFAQPAFEQKASFELQLA